MCGAMRRQHAIHSLVHLARLVSDHKASESALHYLTDALVDQAGADGVAVFQVTDDGLALVTSRGLPESAQSWKVEIDEIGSELGRSLLTTLERDVFTQSKTMPLVSSGGLF